MKTVLAALDNSLAAKPVLDAARALADLLGGDVAALHVRVDGEAGPTALAAAVGVPLRVATGDVVAGLVAAAEPDDVAALVIGARGLPADPRPLGATAAAVATTLPKPVLVVPPDADPAPAFRHALVPLEGSVSTSLAPRSLIELAQGNELEISVVHVLDAESMPLFTDQPQHEQAAWAREFLARYCPRGIDVVRFETRIGPSEHVIPSLAQEWACDLVALGWSQELTAGRGRIVRSALERSRVPVLLVPVRVEAQAPPLVPPSPVVA